MSLIKFKPTRWDTILTGTFCSLFLVGSLYFAFFSSKLTAENLAKVRMGMKLDDVVHVLGTPNDSTTHGALGLTGTTYVYRSGKQEVKVVFINDRVMQVQGHF